MDTSLKSPACDTSGVLFADIFVGHFENEVDHDALDFVNEFELELFDSTVSVP